MFELACHSWRRGKEGLFTKENSRSTTKHNTGSTPLSSLHKWATILTVPNSGKTTSGCSTPKALSARKRLIHVQLHVHILYSQSSWDNECTFALIKASIEPSTSLPRALHSLPWILQPPSWHPLVVSPFKLCEPHLRKHRAAKRRREVKGCSYRPQMCLTMPGSSICRISQHPSHHCLHGRTCSAEQVKGRCGIKFYIARSLHVCHFPQGREISTVKGGN